MRDMGRAMMGTGEATGEGRARTAAEAAITNPLLGEASMIGARGVLISISGGMDMTLFEVDEAATRIRQEVDADADIIVGAIFDKTLEGKFRVSVVATGLPRSAEVIQLEQRIA
jgi:cell division protein FtsZ